MSLDASRRRAWADMNSDDDESACGWNEHGGAGAKLSPMRSRTPSPQNQNGTFFGLNNHLKCGGGEAGQHNINNQENDHNNHLHHHTIYNNGYNYDQNQHQQQSYQHATTSHTHDVPGALLTIPHHHGNASMAGELTPANSDAQTVDSASAVAPQWKIDTQIQAPHLPQGCLVLDAALPHHGPGMANTMINHQAAPSGAYVVPSYATPLGAEPTGMAASMDALLLSYQNMLNCEMQKLRAAFVHCAYAESEARQTADFDMHANFSVHEAAQAQLKNNEAEFSEEFKNREAELGRDLTEYKNREAELGKEVTECKNREATLEREVTELKEKLKAMSTLKAKVQEMEDLEEKLNQNVSLSEKVEDMTGVLAKKDETIASLETRLEQLDEEIIRLSKLQATTECDLRRRTESLKATEQELQKSQIAFEKRKTVLKEMQTSFTRECEQNKREIGKLKAAHAATLQSLEADCVAKKEETVNSLVERLDVLTTEAQAAEEKHRKSMDALREHNELEVSKVRRDAEARMKAQMEEEKTELGASVQELRLELKQTRKDNNTKVRRLEDKLASANAKASNMEKASLAVKKVSSVEIGIQHDDDYLSQKFRDKIKEGKEELRKALERIKELSECKSLMEADAISMNENLDALSADVGNQDRKISEMQRDLKEMARNKLAAEKIAESYHEQNKLLLEEKNRMQQKLNEQQKSLEYMKWNLNLLKKGTSQAHGTKQNVFINPKSSLSCFSAKSDAKTEAASTACPTEPCTGDEMTN